MRSEDDYMAEAEELRAEVERLRGIERAAREVYRVLHEQTRDDIDFAELGEALAVGGDPE